MKTGADWSNEHDLVFTTRTGSPLDGCNVTRDFKRMLKKAQLPVKRFHDLRHTAASLLMYQKVQPRVVMDVLGHAEIRTMLDLYSHVAPVMQRDAADQMDALLTAAWLRANAARPELWAPEGMTPEIARTEGWTFGVA